MKDKLCRYKEEECCSYTGKATHQKSSTIYEDTYIEIDGRMKKMMKTILD